jgi:hypothetical protein
MSSHYRNLAAILIALACLLLAGLFLGAGLASAAFPAGLPQEVGSRQKAVGSRPGP